MLCSGFSVPFSTDGYPVQSDMRIPNVHLIRDTYICAIPGHSMLFKRQMLAYMQGGETLPLYYDWQILNVAAAAESIVFVDKVLVHFRRHNGAATASRPVGNRLLSGGGWRDRDRDSHAGEALHGGRQVGGLGEPEQPEGGVLGGDARGVAVLTERDSLPTGRGQARVAATGQALQAPRDVRLSGRRAGAYHTTAAEPRGGR